jgi:diaminopimelate epimerase
LFQQELSGGEERFVMLTLNFRKMHGLGNDFVVIDTREKPVALSVDQLRFLADRRRGVGCDQVTLIYPSERADALIMIFNADGSEPEACGNVTRCIADLLMLEKKSNTVVIETISGILPCTRAANGHVTVDMGVPRLGWQDIPLKYECDTLHLPLDGDPVGVNVGNPHCVFFVDDAENFPVAEVGRKIEIDPLFPRRTNVEFATILSPDKIRFRVWERGSGITEACGSGACAVLVAAVRRNLTNRKTSVILDGGTLYIEWRESDNHILMTGAAESVFEGTVSL